MTRTFPLPASVTGLLAGLAIAFLSAACAYSSSETPRPLEPDHERELIARQRLSAETAAESPTQEPQQEDPRAPTRSPVSTWGD